uniref:Uncharacterized protein n=1 Tax=Proboscia inermis TaxID=420281 RepID=A0A7S0GB29_9STRA
MEETISTVSGNLEETGERVVIWGRKSFRTRPIVPDVGRGTGKKGFLDCMFGETSVLPFFGHQFVAISSWQAMEYGSRNYWQEWDALQPRLWLCHIAVCAPP